jgi:hypothetical protein
MSSESVIGGRTESSQLQGFDAFEVRLGDLMRGERATLGKSLLDVQRELRIRATYVAAIENGDLGAFESKGFIAGYVRSYARYLGFDPEWAFAAFCAETGFSSVSGQLSERAAEPAGGTAPVAQTADPFASGRFAGSLSSGPALPQINPGALGSFLVLAVLLAGLGYGAWSVLQQVQQVTVAPVDAAPGAVAAAPEIGGAPIERDPVVAATRLPAEGLERLYRPQGLDLPVMTPRDGPIAALDPDTIGALAPDTVPRRMDSADPLVAAVTGASGSDNTAIRVTEAGPPELALIARTPVWVRVRDPGGAVLFQDTLGPGESYTLPPLEGAASLRAGNSGDLYILVDGVPFGPVGEAGTVVSNVALSPEAVRTAYIRTDLPSGLAPSTVAEADSPAGQ